MKFTPSLLFTIVISSILLALLISGLLGETINFENLQSLLGSMRESHTAIFIVIIIFVAASFVGAPQWALITACVVGFGPLLGAIYAWVATLCSASVNFGLARVLGQKRLSRFTSPRMNGIIQRVEQNGVLWSFVVRLVPTGPFILVNFAAGVSTIRWMSFLLGTALGIVPKIIVVALFAKGIFTGLDGRLLSLGFIGLAIIAMVTTFWFQKRLKNRNNPI